MGLFGKKKAPVEEEPDIYDEDEVDELLTDSELFFDAPELKSTTLSITPKDIRRFDTDRWLECIEELPYDFRCYFDTRKIISRAYKSCLDEIADFESYEGGRSTTCTDSFEYDGHDITIDITFSRESDHAPFVFTADIKVDE
ncbi:MAG: hypothetical protein IJU82_05230 [Ruminiclostridium sp.]|nr:hypothetical protein [Ruminiclostridium sp.]